MQKHKCKKNKTTNKRNSIKGHFFAKPYQKKLNNVLTEVFFITKSPEQYTKESNAEEEIRERSEFEEGIVVFDDMLEYNQNAIDPFFTRGKYKDLDV